MSKLLKKILFFLMITTSSFSLYEHEINSLFSDEEIEHNEVLVIEQELKVETVDPLLLRDTYSRRAMNYLYAQFENVDIKGELSSYQRVINSLNLPNYYSYDLYQEDIDTARKIGDLKGKGVIEDTVYDIISLVFGERKDYSLEDKKALESLLNRDATTIYPKEMFDVQITSLEKTIVGEIMDYELEDSLLTFFNLFKVEKNKEYRERIIDKIFHLTYSSRYFIPLAHKQTYILKNKNMVGMR